MPMDNQALLRERQGLTSNPEGMRVGRREIRTPRPAGGDGVHIVTGGGRQRYDVAAGRRVARARARR